MKPITMDGRTLRRFVPHSYPFTLIDSLEHFDPVKHLVVATKLVSQNEPFLQGHFPDYPILPGVIIIEVLAQASGLLMNLEARANSGAPWDGSLDSLEPMAGFLAESRVKFISGVYPGDRMQAETEMLHVRGELYVCKVRALVDGREVAKGQLTMARMLGSEM